MNATAQLLDGRELDGLRPATLMEATEAGLMAGSDDDDDDVFARKPNCPLDSSSLLARRDCSRCRAWSRLSDVSFLHRARARVSWASGSASRTSRRRFS